MKWIIAYATSMVLVFSSLEQNPKGSSERYKLREKAADVFLVKEEQSSLFSFSVSCKAVQGVPPFHSLSQPVVAINNSAILSCCKHTNHGSHLGDSINSINSLLRHNNSFSTGAKTRKNRNWRKWGCYTEIILLNRWSSSSKKLLFPLQQPNQTFTTSCWGVFLQYRYFFFSKSTI